jgi:hypothetical protein
MAIKRNTKLARRKTSMVAKRRGASSIAVNRQRLAANVDGVTYNGRRDMYSALGYARQITAAKFRSRFRRNAVASRIVTAAPKATWRGGAEVIENNTPEQSPFEQAFEAMERRLNLWAIFHRADILAGLGRYAIILLGAPGKMEDPLPASLRPQDLMYLTPFGEDDAPIEKFDTDIKSPRFGLPVMYAVRRMTPNAFRTSSAETLGRRVHYTRVIHVADGLLDDHVYGIPRLEKVWNLLDDLEKVTGGGAEAFWRRADQGLIFNLDPMVQVQTDPATGKVLELEAARDQIENYEHGLERVLMMRGITAKSLGSDVADIATSVTALMGQISAGSEIPQRILMGSEAAKLASLTDADAWDERVADRRTEYAAPQIVLPFCHRMIQHGALPKPKNHIDVRWPELKNLNESQRMDIALKAAQLNRYAGAVVISPAEIRDTYLGLDVIKEGLTAEGDDAVDPNPPPPDYKKPEAAPAAPAAAPARARGKGRSSVYSAEKFRNKRTVAARTRHRG